MSRRGSRLSGGHSLLRLSVNGSGLVRRLSGNYGAFDAIVVGEGSNPLPISRPLSRASVASYVSNGGKVIVTRAHGLSIMETLHSSNAVLLHYNVTGRLPL